MIEPHTGEGIDSPTVHPVTPDRWEDLVRLFGDRGACGGCWCMHWRLPAANYEAGKGAGHRRRLKDRVKSDAHPPGVMAYIGGNPVGWCAVSPRAEYVRLKRSRILAPVDETPVWSIVCLYVDRAHRNSGLSRHLIEAAVGLAETHGALVVEAYPVEPKKEAMPAVFAFTGIASAFRDRGFREVARRSETRPILRREVGHWPSNRPAD